MDCFAALAMTVKCRSHTTTVMPAHAGIQYAAASRFNHCCLWNTGSSAFADDDGCVRSHSRDANCVRGLLEKSFPQREGAGNAGCLLHPRSRVQDVDRCAHEHTGTAGALRHSLRNGLTAYAALSLETNSSCLHHCRLDGSIDPVGSNSPPAAWHQQRVSTDAHCRSCQDCHEAYEADLDLIHRNR